MDIIPFFLAIGVIALFYCCEGTGNDFYYF